MSLPRARTSKKTGSFFEISKYYYLSEEKCLDCNVAPGPSNVYHCAQCHKSVQVSIGKNVRSKLIQHYGVSENHSIDCPPRFINYADFNSLNDDDKLTVSEGIMSFLAASKGVAFSFFSSLSTYVRKCFQKDFQLSRIKCAAINTGVFAKRAEDNLKEELANARFITISFDGSIHHKKKLLPVFATFFQKGKMCHRLLDINILTEEKSDTVTKAVQDTIANYSIADEKIVAVCADNCATNFGNKQRTGSSNVFAQLSRQYKNKLVGIGCLCHVGHNSLKQACKETKIDFETIFYKLHKYFNDSPAKACNYIEVCAALGLSPGLPKSYVVTRWLSMKGAIDTVISSYRLLREYFNSLPIKKVKQENLKRKLPEEELKNFFNNEEVFPWLIVLQELAEEFEIMVRSIEGDNVSLISAISTFNALKIKMNQKEIPFLANEHIKDWPNYTEMKNKIKRVYNQVFDYMESWTKWTKSLDNFNWVTLKEKLTFEQVKSSPISLTGIIDEEALKTEINQVNLIIEENLVDWNRFKMKTLVRWDQVFESAPELNNLNIFLEYAFALPGSNATCERLFSQVKYYWTQWKGNLKPETVVSIMKIRFNLTSNPEEIFDLLVKDEKLRQSVRSNAKYKKTSSSEITDDESTEEALIDDLDFEEEFVDDVFAEEEDDVQSAPSTSNFETSFMAELTTTIEPATGESSDDELDNEEQEPEEPVPKDPKTDELVPKESATEELMINKDKRQALGTPTPIKGTAKRSKSRTSKKALNFENVQKEPSGLTKHAKSNRQLPEYSLEEQERIQNIMRNMFE